MLKAIEIIGSFLEMKGIDMEYSDLADMIYELSDYGRHPDIKNNPEMQRRARERQKRKEQRTNNTGNSRKRLPQSKTTNAKRLPPANSRALARRPSSALANRKPGGSLTRSPGGALAKNTKPKKPFQGVPNDNPGGPYTTLPDIKRIKCKPGEYYDRKQKKCVKRQQRDINTPVRNPGTSAGQQGDIEQGIYQGDAGSTNR